jgi:hypothetical protein
MRPAGEAGAQRDGAEKYAELPHGLSSSGGPPA